MPESVQATSCPHCGKDLKIPTQYLGKALRCKGCSKTFVAGAGKALEKKAPAVSIAAGNGEPKPAVKQAPLDKPAAEEATYIQRYVKRQRTGTYLFLGSVLVALGAIGTGAFLFKDQLVALFDQASRPVPTKPRAETEPRGGLLDKGEVVDQRSGDLTSMPTKEKTETKKGRASFAKIPGPYPGRALLIGIRNYLYLNPLNPGYREERSLGRDPLGLLGLRRMLITEHSFPREQTAVLSDIDDHQAMQPTKGTIESNVEEFLKTTRASDRIILAFVGHAALVGDQAYLLPIDAELPPEGSKPDAERDSKLAQKLVPVKWLYEKLAACPARQKLLIVDVAQNDPQGGVIRQNPGNMTEKLYDQLKAAPKNTQVWLACGVNQYSYLFNNTNTDGSVFLDTLSHLGVFSTPKNWALVEKDPGLKRGTLPILLLAPHAAKEISAYVKSQGAGDQTPQVIGFEGTFTGTPASEPPPPVTLKANKPQGELVSTDELNQLLRELGLENDPMRGLPASSFPAITRAAFAKYAPDYQNGSELEAKAKEMPLRAATLKVIKALNKAERSFKMRFPFDSKNEAAFKKSVEREQEVPAYVSAELSDLLEEMKALEDKREEEPSPRWRAHFDYTRVRLLARLANVQEYGFVLGNKLRKDTPAIKDPKHNGWLIVPQHKLEQKETRTYDSERQKLAAKIIKEHPGTPWEVLARREQGTILGLTLQEAFLEEANPERPRPRGNRKTP